MKYIHAGNKSNPGGVCVWDSVLLEMVLLL